MLLRASAPGPLTSTSGKCPKTVATLVMSTGRRRVAAAAFTVLGTIVGAYFGVRVGAHGKSEAEAARVASEAKVARLALHVDKQDAARVLDDLDR